MDKLGTLLTVCLGHYALAVGIYLVLENRRPQATLAWMLVLFFPARHRIDCVRPVREESKGFRKTKQTTPTGYRRERQASPRSRSVSPRLRKLLVLKRQRQAQIVDDAWSDAAPIALTRRNQVAYFRMRRGSIKLPSEITVGRRVFTKDGNDLHFHARCRQLLTTVRRQRRNGLSRNARPPRLPNPTLRAPM